MPVNDARGDARPAGTRVRRLADDLLSGTPADEPAGELTAWLADSARFRTFAGMHGAKIRKKLRGAADPEARLDVRAELRAAYLLLADRRIEVAFEAYGSGHPGPDFTVTMRGASGFNVEVTRLRHVPATTGLGGTLLAKLRQLPPSAPNAIVIAIDAEDAATFDIAGAVQALRTLADRKDDAFFARRGFDGTRGFYERFLRLGAVVVWCERAAGEARAALWVNRSARIAVPERGARACLACLRAG